MRWRSPRPMNRTGYPLELNPIPFVYTNYQKRWCGRTPHLLCAMDAAMDVYSACERHKQRCGRLNKPRIDSTSVEMKFDEYEVNYRINRRRDSLWSPHIVYLAPKDAKAPLNSLTAVLTSSKFSAEIAQRACFCAFNIASSSTTAGEA